MRTLTVERVYKLGEYKTLRIGDDLQVPDGLEFNNDAVDLLRLLQIYQVEKTMLNYYRLHEEHEIRTDTLSSIESALEMIIELQADTLKTLEKYFKNGEIEK